ncbi:MAG: hypothetical protein ABSG28_02745 [Methanoregula sp.]|jgi:hypothetical protein|uniref:ORC-CDC6 family AAA ATPase n=1 Tax=Methanoregula sp. TaxID=2052170 RepID=UPI003C222AB6
MDFRNPFRLRASEKIVDEETFLRLFGVDALNLLPQEGLWNSIQPFRSSPGAGKTTLFRLFTPKSLHTLYKLRSDDEIKPLFKRLKDLDTISDNGPQVLGVHFSFAKNYANLDDLNFDKGQKIRFFFALINARIIIATLRDALYLKGLEYPDDLKKLHVSKCYENVSSLLPVPCNGEILNNWASNVEKEVNDAIDSFSSNSLNALKGHDSFYCLSILHPQCIRINDQPVSKHSLLMLDDLQALASDQRESIYKFLLNSRLPIGIWIGERLSALKPKEIFIEGTVFGRDINKPLILEVFWRKESKKFEKVLENISNLRVKTAKDIQPTNFSSLLEHSMDDFDWFEKFNNAAIAISERVKKKAGTSRSYEEWINKNDVFDGTTREKTIQWRILEILIDRDKIRSQQRLFEDNPYPELDLNRQEDSSLKSAAEYFISKEFKIPYAYGFSNLAVLSSSNIEQFLELSGDLFDEIIYSKKIKKITVLPIIRQEAIIKKSAKKRWEEIPNRISNSTEVTNFLKAFQKMALFETNKPNAPYAPGVTGLAISEGEFERICDEEFLKDRPKYKTLIETISVCISLNLIEEFSDVTQGQKGKTWKVLYLNRLLCLHFDLPLQKGGWRPKTIDELSEWIENGEFIVPKKRGSNR